MHCKTADAQRLYMQIAMTQADVRVLSRIAYETNGEAGPVEAFAQKLVATRYAGLLAQRGEDVALDFYVTPSERQAVAKDVRDMAIQSYKDATGLSSIARESVRSGQERLAREKLRQNPPKLSLILGGKPKTR
jgi:hypothetical protein